jgi:hypothetical protein
MPGFAEYRKRLAIRRFQNAKHQLLTERRRQAAGPPAAVAPVAGPRVGPAQLAMAGHGARVVQASAGHGRGRARAGPAAVIVAAVPGAPAAADEAVGSASVVAEKEPARVAATAQV